MNFKISIILKSHWPKILSVFLFIILLGAYANIFAIGSPYNPGSTLDPDCAPGDENCTVSIGGGINPWLTSSNGIYYEGGVNIGGSGDPYLDSEIREKSDFVNILPLVSLFSDASFDTYISIDINQEGNPVIAYFESYYYQQTYNFIPTAYASGGNNSLVVLTCLDSGCNEYSTSTIDTNLDIYSGSKPFMKIGSDNNPRIVYFASETNASSYLFYTECLDSQCQNYNSSIVYGYQDDYISFPDFFVYGSNANSLFLDENNNPFILSVGEVADFDDYGSPSRIIISRYTGSGSESSCGIANSSDWECFYVTPEDESYYLSKSADSNGDLIYVDDITGYPVFLADDGNTLFIFECNDSNCNTYTRSPLFELGQGGSPNYILNKNENGDPVVIYNYRSGDNYYNDIKLITLSENEEGDGCLSSGWNCSSILQKSFFEDGYFTLAINSKIGSDGLLRISTLSFIGPSMAGGYIKCSNEDCSTYEIDNIYSTNFNGDRFSVMSLALNSSDEIYLAYFDLNEEMLKIDKELRKGGVSFSSDGDDAFVFGDLGVKGDLFLDGRIISSGNLNLNGLSLKENNYQNVSEEDLDILSFVGLLHNVEGDLFWGFNRLLKEGDTVQNAYYAEHLSQTLGAYNGGTGLTNPGASGNVLTSNGSDGWVSSLPSIKANSSTFLISSGLEGSGDLATYAYNSIFLGAYSGNSATNASSSNFLGYGSGQGATNASSSNFLGYMAGESSSFAFSSNFLGHMAGQGATNASNSNFLGPQSGYFATNAANSIFIGRQSGMNDTVNNTATYNDSTTFANTSILIGHRTRTGGFSNSIAIGAYATNTATNQFMIGSTTRPINTTVWKGTSVTATLDTATGLSTSSDERLKTNIHILNTNEDYMDYASSTRESYTEDEISDMTTLEKVLKITPVRYDWREDPDNEYIFEQDITPENIGFIAQDLINFFPEVVYPGHDENKYLGVNYANMTPILVEAIKEMNLKVESINTFEDEEGNLIENSWRDSFIAWFENIENGIRDLWADRIHVKNELCIGEGIDEVCLNPQELREIKDLIDVEDEIIVNPKDEDPASPSTGTGE